MPKISLMDDQSETHLGDRLVKHTNADDEDDEGWIGGYSLDWSQNLLRGSRWMDIRWIGYGERMEVRPPICCRGQRPASPESSGSSTRSSICCRGQRPGGSEPSWWMRKAMSRCNARREEHWGMNWWIGRSRGINVRHGIVDRRHRTLWMMKSPSLTVPSWMKRASYSAQWRIDSAVGLCG